MSYDDLEDEEDFISPETIEKYFICKSAGNVNYIVVKDDINKAVTDVFGKAYKLWLKEPENLHVIDYKLVTNINQHFFRFLIDYQNKLYQDQKKLVAINVSKDVMEILKHNGVDDVFNIVENLGAIKNYSSKNILISKISKGISDSMTGALKEFFLANENFLASNDEPAKVKLKNDYFEDYHYLAILPFTGSAFEGDIRLVVTKQTLIIIYNHMMKKDVTRVSAAVIDYMKEFLNVLFGKVKNTIGDSLEEKLTMGIPIVCNWKEIKNYVSVKPYHTSLIYSFEINEGEGNLNLNIANTSSP